MNGLCGWKARSSGAVWKNWGGRHGLSILTSLLVSVDIKLYWTMLSLSLICQPASGDIKQQDRQKATLNLNQVWLQNWGSLPVQKKRTGQNLNDRCQSFKAELFFIKRDDPWMKLEMWRVNFCVASCCRYSWWWGGGGGDRNNYF